MCYPGRGLKNDSHNVIFGTDLVATQAPSARAMAPRLAAIGPKELANVLWALGAAHPAGVAALVPRLAERAARPALAARFDSQHRSAPCFYRPGRPSENEFARKHRLSLLESHPCVLIEQNN